MDPWDGVTEADMLPDHGEAVYPDPPEEEDVIAELSREMQRQTGGGKFVIDSEESADWYLGKVIDKQAAIARLKAQYKERLADLERDLNRMTGFFEPQLRQWADSERERRKGGKDKNKTLKLWNGNICFRAAPAQVTVSDPEAAFEYARTSLPDAIKTVVSLNEAAYRAAFEATGDADMPGLTITPARENMSIKAAAQSREHGRAVSGERDMTTKGEKQ